MSLRLRLAQLLVATAFSWALSGALAVGEQPESLDQRLLFDPGTLARSRLIVAAPSMSSIPQADISRDVPHVAIEESGGMILPELTTALAFPDISSAVKQSVGPIGVRSADAGGLDPRVGLGTFSVGFDTDTSSRPRIPLAGDTSETGYDTSYDPKHPHPLPFIGLSAKSILP